ncbi:hypothetical protein AK812_SmicGene1266 [Symbiodinium microadriaticum]|uniref:Uncharacterized protein n=1 Tax=Symbiodinium microadriaticum TaxID=2951 RepID=A0A1Q9F4K4_SYMMI|nr:hypothetical protein AK812_SmicGene1266 [Symbiodinium microadriaticum]CAE6928976.1 unnamed protein product [Symbiodinium sp. KB8]CAE7839408.1 unnamed protein product [Symbiodinium microadriaticum]
MHGCHSADQEWQRHVDESCSPAEGGVKPSVLLKRIRDDDRSLRSSLTIHDEDGGEWVRILPKVCPATITDLFVTVARDKNALKNLKSKAKKATREAKQKREAEAKRAARALEAGSEEAQPDEVECRDKETGRTRKSRTEQEKKEEEQKAHPVESESEPRGK